jgi:hypothetical protein
MCRTRSQRKQFKQHGGKATSINTINTALLLALQPRHQLIDSLWTCWTLAAPVFSISIAAQAQADLQPVYRWAWAVPSVCLHGQCTKARCTCVLLWTISKGAARKFIVPVAGPDTGRFPAYVSYGPWPDQSTGGPSHLRAYGPAGRTAAWATADPPPVCLRAWAVPAISLTSQPRHKLIYSQCTYGPGQC